MMRILIVDDELPIQRGISSFLHSRLLGNHEINTAGGGAIALKIIDDGWNPDVLLTDVLMPDMDGLELARHARDRLPLLRIIIVSGSSEFAHVKASIQCEADDYLLKPVLPAELLRVVNDTLKRAVNERRDRERVSNQNKLINEMLPHVRAAMLIGLLSHDGQDSAQNSVQLDRLGLQSFIENNLSIVVFWTPPYMDGPRLSPQLVSQLSQFPIRENMFYLPMDEHTVALVWSLGDNDDGAITDDQINATLQTLATAGISPVYVGISTNLNGAQALRGGYRTALAAAQRQKLANIVLGQAFEIHRAENALYTSLAQQHGSRSQRLVNNMRHIAWTRYEQPISLKSISIEMNVTPNYLSALFKQEKGVTFVDYLTNIRMKRARELLDDSTMKVSDIARVVGYEDPNYFTRVFRRQQGITPSEYRERT